MAQDFKPKRLDIASSLVEHATNVMEALNFFATYPPLLAETGTAFSDGDDEATPPVASDFAGSDIQHVNSYILHVLRDAINNGQFDAALALRSDPNDGGSPTLGTILRAIQKAG